MIPTDPLLRQVGRFWAAYQARDWVFAQTLLSPNAQCCWWATRERFSGASAVVGVNAAYPEGWTIHLLELHRLAADRVLALVRVDHGERSYWCHSHAGIGHHGIETLDEYWSDDAEPPEWRAGTVGRSLLPADTRAGLPLDIALWA